MKKILFIVNVDTFFISHRLPIAMECIKQNYQVHLVCATTNAKQFLEERGITVHSITLSRIGISILEELKSCMQIYKIVKSLKPDVVHMVTSKPVAYGGVVCRLLNIKKRVVSISGLGYAFIDKSVRARIIKNIILCLYRYSLKNDKTLIIFQNENDRDIFVDREIIHIQQSILIRGSGVDLKRYIVKPEPKDNPVVMFISRLLYDKGIREFIRAVEVLKSKRTEFRAVLVGSVDSNPNSAKESEIQAWVSSGIIEYWGFRNDIPEVLGQSNIVVLPSYREGLPKCLIEAAACGRAVVTTDVPGCRDAITPDVTGLLVKVKDHISLAEAMERLIHDSALRNRMAINARKLAVQSFDINMVIRAHMQIYRSKRTSFYEE